MKKILKKSDVDKSRKAIEFVKNNKEKIISHFSPNEIYLPNRTTPVSIFMAGSPGAGKTEFAKKFLELDRFKGQSILRIDPDDIRKILPGYKGNNSYIFQGAASIAVDKIHDHALNTNKHFIFDSTLADYDRAAMNIGRSLKRGRHTEVFYIHTSPREAWDFTQERELREGRRIEKEDFIELFIAARDSFKMINSAFYKEITTWVVIKSYTTEFLYKIAMHPENIDVLLPRIYSKEDLIRELL